MTLPEPDTENLTLDLNDEPLLKQIDDLFRRAPDPKRAFPEFDQLVQGLIQFDRMVIGYHLTDRSKIQLAYVSGDEYGPFTPDTLHSLSHEALKKWQLDPRTSSSLLPGSDSGPDIIRPFNIGAGDKGFKSWLIVPIVWQEEVVGDVLFRSYREDVYQDREIEIANHLASSMAGTVANARAVAKGEYELKLRKDMLELSRLVNSVQSLQDVDAAFGKIILTISDSDRVTISTPQTSDNSAINMLVFGDVIPGLEAGAQHPPLEGEELRWLHEETAYHVEPAMKDESEIVRWSESVALEAGLRSTMVAPIRWQGETISAITFRSRNLDTFTASHLEIATEIATQVAGAIANQTALQKSKAMAAKRDALATISRSITSSRDLQETFETFAESVATLIPWDRLAITMLPELDPTGEFVFQTGVEFPETEGNKLPFLIRDLVDAFTENPTPVIVGDQLESKFSDLKRSQELAISSGLNSWLLAPIIWQGDQIGHIHIRSNHEDAYNNSHIIHVRDIADQVSGIFASNIANRQLAHEANIRNVLAELGRVIGASRDFASAFPDVENLISSVIGFDGISIGALIPNTELAHRTYTTGDRRPIGETFDLGESISIMAARSGKTERRQISSIDELHEFPRSIDRYLAGTRVFLNVPLVSNDSIVGILQFRSDNPDAFNESDLETAQRIAAQIAGALANSLADEQIHLQAAALESSDSAIIITSPSGDVEWANSAFTRLTGWSSTEIIGQNTSLLKSADSANWREDEEIWAALNSGKSWNGIHINRKKDGSEFPEDLTATPVTGADGEITHIIGIKRDVTDRLVAEEAHENSLRMESENRELQRIAAARSEFLSTVSHELRTPLTTVSAFADILFNSSSENLTERQLTHLSLIRKSSSQLGSLIDDLLDVSQADSGRLVLDKSAFAIEPMIEELGDTSRVLLATREQMLEIESHVNDLLLRADRPRVIQVISNLLTNAAKFSPEGSTIRLISSVENSRLLVTVADQGSGITKADQVMMFSPFFRGDNGKAVQPDGRGLGLAVVRSLVDLHDGTITVDSKYRKGTSITVTLPGVTSEPIDS